MVKHNISFLITIIFNGKSECGVCGKSYNGKQKSHADSLNFVLFFADNLKDLINSLNH